MIFNIFNSVLIYILFADFIERRFPDHFYNSMVCISYNCIFYFSKSQIFFIKYIEKNPYYLKLLNTIKNKNDSDNETNNLFIKNNCVSTIPDDSVDFSIISDISNTTLKKIIYKNNSKTDDFEESNIKFMLIELKIDEESYKIELKTDKYNYYIVNNEFTKDFFIFYVYNYIFVNKEFKIKEDSIFSLKIIDHNVNICELNFTDKNESIIINKDDYKIINK